jgi:DNA-binding protein H-NS
VGSPSPVRMSTLRPSVAETSASIIDSLMKKISVLQSLVREDMYTLENKIKEQAASLAVYERQLVETELRFDAASKQVSLQDDNTRMIM